MIRTVLAAIAVMLSVSVGAEAQTGFVRWTDPSNRLSFEHPSDWYVNQMRSQTEGAIRVAVGAADYECQIWLLPRPATASASPDEVRQRYIRPIPAEEWASLVAPLREFQGEVVASDTGVDAGGAWPTQHAVVRAGAHEARVTLQGRPGLELISLCQSFDGQDRNAIFGQIAASIDAGQ